MSLVRTKWNTILQGDVRDTISRTERYKIRIITIFSIVGLTATIPFSVLQIISDNIFVGVTEIVLSVVVIINLIILRLKKNTEFAATVILSIMVVLLLVLQVSGGLNNTGVFWFYVFPPLALFLKGSKKGLLWVAGLLVAGIALNRLGLADTIEEIYGLRGSAAVIASYIVVTALLLSYARLDEQQKNQIVQHNRELSRYKQALDQTSDHVIITDSEGTVLYANAAIEKITGYSPSEVLGSKAGTLWSKPMPKDFYEKLWNTIKIKKQTFAGEFINVRKDGREYVAFATISPVLDEKGAVKYFIGIERDITQETEVDRAKTEFVSLASHQLRTPLSAIGWYTEMLLNGDAGTLTKEQKDYLQEVATGNMRMIELIDALLNVSRLELGTFLIEPKPTDITKLAREVVKELQPKIAAKKLSVQERYARLPKIPVDANLMRIVFQNLISNAVKYTPPQETVIITIARVQKTKQLHGQRVPKNTVLISVKDTGIGIPERQQSHIFTKLFRADNAKVSDTEGTGLGLYIAKSILDQSGGSIGFTSKEGQGTTFYATLPLSGMKKKKGTKALS